MFVGFRFQVASVEVLLLGSATATTVVLDSVMMIWCRGRSTDWTLSAVHMFQRKVRRWIHRQVREVINESPASIPFLGRSHIVMDKLIYQNSVS